MSIICFGEIFGDIRYVSGKNSTGITLSVNIEDAKEFSEMELRDFFGRDGIILDNPYGVNLIRYSEFENYFWLDDELPVWGR